MRVRRALGIPDTHRPYFDKRAYKLMLKVARYLGVDEIFLYGDYGDFISVTSHKKDPRLAQFLLDEVRSVNEGLDELDYYFPRAKKVYLEGNHEYRLERYLTEQAPALLGLTSCRDLFRIRERKRWSYLDYGRTQAYRVLGSDLYARHTPLAASADCGLARASASYTFGHCHQIKQAAAVGLDGRAKIAFSPGWLGDAKSAAFSYMQNPTQWQLGFALVSVFGSSKAFSHEVVRIQSDYTCITHGKRFAA